VSPPRGETDLGQEHHTGGQEGIAKTRVPEKEKKNNISQRLLVSFYRSTMESILTYCLCTWFANCTVATPKWLRKSLGVLYPHWRIFTTLTASGEPTPS